jgi:hypothetical protein
VSFKSKRSVTRTDLYIRKEMFKSNNYNFFKSMHEYIFRLFDKCPPVQCARVPGGATEITLINIKYASSFKYLP